MKMTKTNNLIKQKIKEMVKILDRSNLNDFTEFLLELVWENPTHKRKLLEMIIISDVNIPKKIKKKLTPKKEPEEPKEPKVEEPKVEDKPKEKQQELKSKPEPKPATTGSDKQEQNVRCPYCQEMHPRKDVAKCQARILEMEKSTEDDLTAEAEAIVEESLKEELKEVPITDDEIIKEIEAETEDILEDSPMETTEAPETTIEESKKQTSIDIEDDMI